MKTQPARPCSIPTRPKAVGAAGAARGSRVPHGAAGAQPCFKVTPLMPRGGPQAGGMSRFSCPSYCKCLLSGCLRTCPGATSTPAPYRLLRGQRELPTCASAVLDLIFPSRAQLRVLRLLQPSQPCARLPAPPALLQSILSLSPPCPCLTQGCVIPTLVSSRRHNSSY